MKYTYTAQIMSILLNLPRFKMIEGSFWSIADGAVGLFHIKTDEDEEGQLYEIEVRPASLSRHKDIFKELIEHHERGG